MLRTESFKGKSCKAHYADRLNLVLVIFLE